MFDILKKIAIAAAAILALQLLGTGINNLIDWSFLVSAFRISRTIIDPVDLFLDTTTIITIVGKMLSIIMAIWVARGSIYIFKLFNSRA